MRTFTTLQTRIFRFCALQCVMLSAGLLLTLLFAGPPVAAQAPASAQAPNAQPHKSRSHRSAKKEKPSPAPVAQTAPPAPPMPDWPVNDKPNPASVVWDATGLRINASNASLQQILKEVATETGAKVEGPVPDQRVYGDFGPGQARDVLSQLLQGSGFNILLAGDVGQGAPREIVLSPRLAGAANSPNGMNRPQQDPDEDIPEQPEDQPQQAAPSPQMQNTIRPGFGPNGPVRTPQQVMEEMQQRQMQQQQQLQQQQQANPSTSPPQ